MCFLMIHDIFISIDQKPTVELDSCFVLRWSKVMQLIYLFIWNEKGNEWNNLKRIFWAVKYQFRVFSKVILLEITIISKDHIWLICITLNFYLVVLPFLWIKFWKQHSKKQTKKITFLIFREIVKQDLHSLLENYGHKREESQKHKPLFLCFLPHTFLKHY